MDNVKKYMDSMKFNAIIFDDYISSELNGDDLDYLPDREYVISSDFIDYLYMKTHINEVTEIFDRQVKNNIFDVIMFIRNNIKENRSEVIKKLNEIIIVLNKSDSKGSASFYKEQYLKRIHYYNEKGQRKFPELMFTEYDDSIEYLSFVRESISLDYGTVEDILEKDDEEFLSIEESFINEYFLYTISKILYDCPELFLNERFKNRALYILKKIQKGILKFKKNKNEQEEILGLEELIRSTKMIRLIEK